MTLPVELLERLLAPESAEARAAYLDSLGMRSARGLQSLLDHAAQLVASDPGKGRQLAAIAADLATEAGVPIARPRAHYLMAQAHASNAEFEAARRLIEQTRAEFEALDEPVEALRTNLGLMHVLREQGRYQEALDAGRAVVEGLDRPDEGGDERARQGLRAMVEESWGTVFEEMGRYDEALRALTSAEAAYRSLDMPERLGAVSVNRGVVLLGLGYASDALAAFEAAEGSFAAAGLTLPRASTLLNIGNAHLLLGAYSRALVSFEQARQLFADLDALAETPVLLLDTADAYLALNLYPEAIGAYSEADTLLQAAGMPYDRARALWGMGAALARMARLDEAEAALSEAAALFRAADNLPLLSSVMLEQASLKTMRADSAAALALGQAALALIAGHDVPIQQVYAHLRVADLLLPDVAAAEDHLGAARIAAETVGLPHLRYRVLQRLGQVRRLQGRPAEALVLLEAAVVVIESLRGTLPFEAVRSSFLHDKTAAYEELLQLHLAAQDPEAPSRAFAGAERAKSRSLVDLLAGGVEAHPRHKADPYVDERRAALEADLNAIYLELLGGAPDSGQRAHLPMLRARAAGIERELRLRRLRAASAVSAGAPPDATSRAVALCPSADATLVAYHIVGDEVLAFVCAGGAVHVARSLCRLEAAQGLIKRLGDQWDRFRAGPDFVAKHSTTLTRTTQRVLQDLYQALVAPLEPLLAPVAAMGAAPRLTIVPHGALHQVPFHALYDGASYLIDRFTIGYAPSATVMSLCEARQPREQGPTLLVGVADPDVPAVATEIATLRQALPTAEVLCDGAATRAAVAARAASCAALHMACHGLYRADNPLYSALRLGDGWLTAADVLSFDLEGALVVLSACESGRGAILGGDEVIGLARSFLEAGAVTLVVSLWLVQDQAAAELMADWYQHMANGSGRAAALREAQIALRAAYPHPYYWAPFLLMGRP